MHGGQTVVPCGRTCLLPWGRPAMVKQEKAVLLSLSWEKSVGTVFRGKKLELEY